MAVSDSINKGIAKATQLAGLANVLSGGSLFPGINGPSPSENKKDVVNFLGTLNKVRGLQRSSHYYVEVNVPPCAKSWMSIVPTLSFLTESAALPGVSLATTDIRRHGYGPVEKKPYAPIFVDTTLSFYVDNSGLIQRFFYYWMNSIVKYNTLINGGSTSNPPTGQNMSPFEVGFKDDYATDITITTIDEAGNDVTKVKLFDAYPIFMGDIPLSWADSDSIARLPITFTYYNYQITNFDAANFAMEEGTPNRPGGDLLGTLQKTASAVQILSSLRKPNNVADITNVVNNATILLGGLR